MDEVGVDGREVGPFAEHVEQLLAHAHQRGGAARREVEAAEQLLPARLGGVMQAGGRLRIGSTGVVGKRALDRGHVGAEALQQQFEEDDPAGRVEPGVGFEQARRQGHARCLALARQQRQRQRLEPGGVGRSALRPAQPFGESGLGHRQAA